MDGEKERKQGKKRSAVVGGEGAREGNHLCGETEQKDGAVMRQGSAPRPVIIATGRGN